MDTPEAILITQIPIAVAILLLAYEIHLIRIYLKRFVEKNSGSVK